MATLANLEDPRVRRTRQLLLQAFLELMTEKPFRSISVQDIAERATVNRATFYAHFTDKYDLMDASLREAFRHDLGQSLSIASELSPANLRTFIGVACAYLKRASGQCRVANREFHPLFESILQDEMHRFIRSWLVRARGADADATELTATVISWATFGTGLQLTRGVLPGAVDDVARQVVSLMVHGLPQLRET